MSEKLKPCPYCKSQEIKTEGYQASSLQFNAAGFYHRTQCLGCGASVTSVTKEACEEKWNTRSAGLEEIKLPKFMETENLSGVPDHLVFENRGWNACLTELRRLNGLEEEGKD